MFVVELDDAAWPRRRPDRPNLFLGTTASDPHERFSYLRSAKGKGIVHDHGKRLRLDLTRNYPRTDEAGARRQKRKLGWKLQRRGFTVNGDVRVWHLYVIELDDDVGDRADSQLPWVYVGETSIDPVDRLEQHLSGARNGKGPLFSRVVRDHGVRLRPDLVKQEPVIYTAEDAKIAEQLLADRLRRAGFSVRGGH